MAVVVLAIALLLGGALFGWSMRRRWWLIAGLLVAAALVNLVLPEGNALRLATGGSAGPWGLLLGLGAIVAGYRRILGQLRSRAEEKQAEESRAVSGRLPAAATGDAMASPAAGPAFGEAELSRYARHIMLREIGGPGQKRLKQARVLVIGAGGLGAPALLYLAAAGVGTIGIVDDDSVDDSNLQRQVIHDTDAIGQRKTASAAARIAAINPHVVVLQHDMRLEPGSAAPLLAGYDVILEGSDSFATRRAVNTAAVAQGKPVIGGALTQWEGQVSVWDPARGAPCYHCVFPEDPAPGLVPTCAEAGVLGPLPGIIGAMMAAEAVKIVTRAGDPLRGRLLLWDALYAESRVIAVSRRPDCPVCGGTHGASGG